jgi:hypothetical protein
VQQIALRPDDSELAIRDLDTLRERPQVIAAIAAAGNPYQPPTAMRSAIK